MRGGQRRSPAVVAGEGHRRSLQIYSVEGGNEIEGGGKPFMGELTILNKKKWAEINNGRNNPCFAQLASGLGR